MKQKARTSAWLAVAALLLCLPLASRTETPAAITGTWAPASSLLQPRSGAAAELLADGRLLITGGEDASGPLRNAEFFLPDGSAVEAPPMAYARSQHASVLLADGRVLVAGGVGADGQATDSAEIFDPASNSWTPTGSLILPRFGHTASRLQDGRVLIAGGVSTSGPTHFLEIFDPSAGTFTLKGGLNAARQDHAAAVLQDGRVLIVGGSDGTQTLASSELYDPAADAVSPGPDLTVPRRGLSATTLLDGEVLVAGGNDGSHDLASAEVYDPTGGHFSPLTSTLATARSGHLAYLLPHNNGVLLVGGTAGGAALSTSELYLPWRSSFRATGTLASSRRGATGHALAQDGLLLVAGGSNGSGDLSSTEFYRFATLTTDKPDYAPKETVTIKGTGWQPGEKVTLKLHEVPTLHADRTIQTFADASGNLFSDRFQPEAHDLGITFYLTAKGSISEAQIVFTDKSATTTSVTSSLNPSSFGQYVTFTATVTSSGSGNQTPRGSVQFKVDGANFGGTIDVSRCGAAGTACASLSTNFLTVGSHTVEADYTGDGNFLSSAGTLSPDQVVNKGATSTTVTSTPNPSEFGQTVTFTATVSTVAPGTGTPTGGVTFYDGATAIGTGTLNNAGWTTLNCGPTLACAALSLGAHSITAVYDGNSNLSGSTSSVLAQTVTKVSTTVALVSSANPSALNQPVTFTATLDATYGAGTATGTITFKDGTTTLGSSAVAPGGYATFTTLFSAAGAHSITAVYGGDSNFNGSTSAPLTQTVNGLATTTELVSSGNPSLFGQAVTFTATVKTSGGTPTGTVTFKDGAITLGTGTLTDGWTTLNCGPTFACGTLSVGAHSITAVYGGDSNYNTSTSAPLTQTVNQEPTSTAVVSSLNPSALGESVTFTATVSVTPGVGTPTGTVTFKDGAATLGTGTLNGSGWATFSTSSLVIGPHSITAVYSGDTNFAGSTSTPLTQTVSGVATLTALASSANPSLLGETVTFTATVSAPSGGTPTGTVTFKDGATTLGTGALNVSGWTTLNCGPALACGTLAVGAHSITAVYGGDSNFASSTSSVVTQTVNQALTSTAVASSLNPSLLGESVTITATISVLAPGSGTPTGTVTFKDGATILGTGTLTSGAWTTFTTSALAVGSHSITAVYGGDGNFAGSTSSVLTQTVNQKATMISPVDGSTLPSSTVTFSWTTGSGVSSYWLWVGTLGTGSLNLYDNGGASTSAVVSNLPADGSAVYVRLFSVINGAYVFNDYVYTATSATKAVMTSPTPGTTLHGSSVTFNWSTGTGVSSYWLWVGTLGPGSLNLYDNGGASTSATLNNLPADGSTIYVRLFSLINGAYVFNDYTYTSAP